MQLLQIHIRNDIFLRHPVEYVGIIESENSIRMKCCCINDRQPKELHHEELQLLSNRNSTPKNAKALKRLDLLITNFFFLLCKEMNVKTLLNFTHKI